MGTEKNLFRPVPVSRNGARVLPLEVEIVPGHGIQIFARTPTKTYVQTNSRVRKTVTGTSMNGALGLRPCSHLVPEHCASTILAGH